MIVADENVDQVIITHLRENKCQVVSIREKNPGISDSEVIKQTIINKALLITEDKDFGELVFSHGIKDCSVVLLRCDSPPDSSFLAAIRKALEHNKLNPGHYFYTVTPKKIRFRKI